MPTKNRARKILLPILFLLIGGLALAYLIKSKPQANAPSAKEKTWRVQAQPLQAAALAPEIEVQGKVESPNSYQAAAPGAGWVTRVAVQEGDQVEEGALLVQLDPRDFTIAITQAEADLAEIEARLTEAEITHQQNQAALQEERDLLALTQKSVARSTQLKNQSLGSDSALDNAEKELKRQQLALNQRALSVKSYAARKHQLESKRDRANAVLAKAQLALQRSEVRAPYAGVISSVTTAADNRVNTGQELLSLYAPAQLEVRALIPAQYTTALDTVLRASQPLAAIASTSHTAFQLVRLAGQAKPGGVEGFFRPLLPQASLRPGGLVSLRLKLPTLADVYPVPPAAVYNNKQVFLLREGRLAGVGIEIVGQTRNAQNETIFLVRSDEIKQDEQLVLTRLPNATSGLKVAVLGANKKPDRKQQGTKPTPGNKP